MIDLGDTRLLIVAGKGGVGKTTVAAVLAEWARRQGRRVALVDIEGRPGLGAMFGHDEPLGFEPTTLADGLTARSIAADQALVEYLNDHGLQRFSKRLADSGALEVIASGAPGLRDLLVLGKVKQLALAGDSDLVIVDSPASGHGVSLLRSPQGLLDAVRGGPVRVQAEDVLTLLHDPTLCCVALVTLAEEMPVNETLETAIALRDRIGVRVAGVLVNQIAQGAELETLRLPEVDLDPSQRAALEAATNFTLRRVRAQRLQIARLSEYLVVGLPALPVATLDALVECLS